MAEKPTILQFMGDLVDTLEKLPYAREHIDFSRERQIVVSCQEGSLVITAKA